MDPLLLWVHEAAPRRESRLLSWDALRPTNPSPTPFLSEQSHSYQLLSKHHLFKSLKTTILGTSSALHTWDPATESFIAHRGLISIDGKNEVVSERHATFACSEPLS